MPSHPPRRPGRNDQVAPVEHLLREAAVAQRNRAYDGEFLFSVENSGVYCRPSCPARQARAAGLRFFASARAAIAAGLRPCPRCQPRAPHAPLPAAATIRALCRHIAEHADEPLSLAALSALSGYSASHLQRTFKAIVGVSPKEFQAALRHERVKRALREGLGVTEAVYAAGFGSASRLYEQVDARLGMTPSAYRAGGAGETIAYACRQTAQGLLMMAATDRGVCFVEFGTSPAALLARLGEEYPRARLEASGASHSAELDRWLEALDAHLAGRGPQPGLPLDLRGTAFQISVWQFLRRIPPGTTLSYSELAARLKRPAAVRAVASACARNRVAILIPCHRVLRSDGSLGGYRWGLERKRALLAAEARSR